MKNNISHRCTKTLLGVSFMIFWLKTSAMQGTVFSHQDWAGDKWRWIWFVDSKRKTRLIFQGSWHPGRDHLNEPIGFHLNSDVLKARDTIFMETTLSTLFQAPEKKPYLESLNDDKLEPLMPTFRPKTIIWRPWQMLWHCWCKPWSPTSYPAAMNQPDSQTRIRKSMAS